MTHRAEYERYIGSERWAMRREAFFSTHERVCAACGTRDEIQVHHRTYARMGQELDGDLVALCQAHHSFVHQHHRYIGGDLAEATSRALQLLRSRAADTSRRGPVEFVPRHMRENATRDPFSALDRVPIWVDNGDGIKREVPRRHAP